MISQTEVTSL